jgi:hypothetical protein
VFNLTELTKSRDVVRSYLQNGRLMRELAGTPAEPDFLPVAGRTSIDEL